MWPLDIAAQVKCEQYRDELRVVEKACPTIRRMPLSLSRRAARPLGCFLVRLGTILQRYGRMESSTIKWEYRPSTEANRLN